MNKYQFDVTYTVSVQVEVEAEDLAEAESKARNLDGREYDSTIKRVRINSLKDRQTLSKVDDLSSTANN